MAITVVQCASVVTSSVSAATITWGTATTIGNVIVIFSAQGASSTSTMSFTLSGNTFTQVGTYSTTTNRAAGMFVSQTTASDTQTKVTWSGSLVTTVAVTAYEISGLATSSVVDSSANSANGGTTNLQLASGALTTTNANDILIYAVGASANETSFALTGYTFPTNGMSTRIGMAYQVVAATQSALSVTMTWSSANADSAGIFAGFKAAAGGGPTVLYSIPLTGAGQA